MAKACMNRAEVPEKRMLQFIMAGMHPTKMPAGDSAEYGDDSKGALRPKGQAAGCRQVSQQVVDPQGGLEGCRQE